MTAANNSVSNELARLQREREALSGDNWKWQPGTRISLGLIFIDRVGSTTESMLIDPEKYSRRQSRYQAGVEEVARSFGAYEPMVWQGDGAMLLFSAPLAENLPTLVARAGLDLWQRCAIDLGMAVRLAGHVIASVEWNPEPGKLAHRELNLGGHLLKDTPSGRFVVSEDVYLGLTPAQQLHFESLGRSVRDGQAAYGFPSQNAGHSETFADDEDHHVWERLRQYCLGPQIARLRYVGFRLQRKEPPSLPVMDVFVPPSFESSRQTSGAESLYGQGGSTVEHGERSLGRLMSASAGLLVLGEPGAGKTTLLRWLAIVAAGGRFSLQTRLGLDERRLPLPVSVGRLAELRAPAPTPGFALDALAAYFADLIGLDVVRLKTFLERALSKGECLVLLDGLDEVGRDREAVIRWLEDLAFAFPKNRFVASSRIVGYQRMHLPVATEIRLTPFSDLQIERYLRGFNHGCLAQEGDPDAGRRVADRETDTLLAAIREIPRLAAVARNPFLLSALALIHRAEGQLPQHRIIFYQMVARTLCETWEDARRLVAGSSKPQLRYEDEALPILGELAIAMHRKHPTGAAPRNEVLRILANALKRRKALSSDEAMESAKAFLQKASTDVGLLCERGRGIWGFLHLTFQEFFVAAGLHARESFEREAFKNLFEPRWEEVIRLGIGYLAIVQVRPEAAARFVQKARQKTAPEYAAWISNVLQKQIPLAALLATEVGEALAAPIRRPILRDFIEWVWNMPEGPAGRFLREIGLNGAPEVRNAIAERLADSSPTIVARAAWAAGEHGDKALLPKIAELIRHSSSRVRISAVDAVARLGPESLTLELAARLKEDSSEEVRAACAVALGATGDKKVIPFLQSSLDDSDGFVVFAAAEAIAQIQPVLAWALKDPADPRRFVVPAFVNATGIGSDQDRKMLDTLTSDPDPEVRRVALRAIAVTRDDAFLPSVERASQDPDDFVRFWATTAIAWIKGKEALPVLNRALRDPSNLVRSAALRSLARLDSAGAFSALKESAEDKERFWMSAKVEVLSNQAAAVGVPCLLATLDQLGPDHKDRPLILEALWEFSEPGPMELSKVVVSRETAPT